MSSAQSERQGGCREAGPNQESSTRRRAILGRVQRSAVQLIIPARHNALANHGELRFARVGRGLFPTLAKLDKEYRKEMGLPRMKRGTKGGARKGKQL